MKLEGKVAIVTGAGQGIGRAIALTLAGQGADVALVGRTQAKLEAVAGEIESLGRQVTPMQADVTIKAQVEAATQAAVKRFGRIDILVNNAGLAMVTPALEISEEQWDRLFAVNAKAPFLFSQAVAREMMGRGGVIVNVLGLAAQIGIPKMADACASKGALAMLTKALAVEWARQGIRVNAVSPGWTLTPLGEKMLRDDPQTYQDRQQRIPLGRAAKPEDVANAVAYLCAPENSYLTGQVIMLDGGLLSIHPAHV